MLLCADLWLDLVISQICLSLFQSLRVAKNAFLLSGPVAGIVVVLRHVKRELIGPLSLRGGDVCCMVLFFWRNWVRCAHVTWLFGFILLSLLFDGVGVLNFQELFRCECTSLLVW